MSQFSQGLISSLNGMMTSDRTQRPELVPGPCSKVPQPMKSGSVGPHIFSIIFNIGSSKF